MPISTMQFDVILQRSKSIYVIALDWSTFTFCLLLIILHTNNCTVAFKGTCPVFLSCLVIWVNMKFIFIWTASSEFGTYRLCEQRRFRRACISAQSRQNLRCSLIQAVNQEKLSDRKPDPWPLWMAGHTQLKFVMTECSKTQIRLTGLIYLLGRLKWNAQLNVLWLWQRINVLKRNPTYTLIK